MADDLSWMTDPAAGVPVGGAAPVVPVPAAPSGPPDMSNQYNTQLTPEQEAAFQKTPFARDVYDYDARGEFLAGQNRDNPTGHGTDTFKKPNHPTFSTGSQYNGVDGYQGGVWGGGQNGQPWTFAPSPTNLTMHGPEGLQQYFQQREPGNQLLMPPQSRASAAPIPQAPPLYDIYDAGGRWTGSIDKAFADANPGTKQAGETYHLRGGNPLPQSGGEKGAPNGSPTAPDMSWMASPEAGVPVAPAPVEGNRFPVAPGQVTGPRANIGAGIKEGVVGTLSQFAGAPVDLAMRAPNFLLRSAGLPQVPLASNQIAAALNAGGPQAADIAPGGQGEAVLRGLSRGAAGMATGGGIGLATGVPSLAAGATPAGALMGGVGGAVGQAARDVVPPAYGDLADTAGNILGGGAVGGATALTRGGIDLARPIVSSMTAPLTESGRTGLAAQRVAKAATDLPNVRDVLQTPPIPLVPGSAATPYQVTADPGLGSLERGVSRDARYAPQFNQLRADQNQAHVAEIERQAPPVEAAQIGPWVRQQLADMDARGEADLGAAREAARGTVENTGALTTPQAAGATVRQGVETARAPVVAASDAALQRAGQQAEVATRGLGGAAEPNAEQLHGARMRGAKPEGETPGTGLEGVRAPVKAATSRLYAVIDPEGKLALDVSDVGRTARELLEQANNRMGGRAAPAESAALGDAAALRGVELFSDLRSLRMAVTDALREIRNDPKLGAESRPYRRMSILLESIDATIAKGATDAAARDTGVASRLAASIGHGEPAGSVGSGEGIPAGAGAEVGAGGGGGANGGGRAPVGGQGGAGGDRGVAPEAATGGSGHLADEGVKDAASGLGIRLSAAQQRHATILAAMGADAEDAVRSALQGEAPVRGTLEPNFTPKDRDALRAANAAYADYKARFGQGAVGETLASSSRTPNGYRLPDSAVPSKLFAGGSKGAEAADSLIAATGSREDALKVLGDYPAFSLRAKAEQMGRLSLPEYQRWMDAHRAVLDKFPELRARFNTAAKASGELERLHAERKALDASHPLNPGWGDAEIMERFVVPGPKGFESAANLIRETNGSPASMQATKDYLAWKLRDAAEVRSGPNAGTLDAGAYDHFMKAHDSFLSHPAMADVRARFDTARRAQQALDEASAQHIAARQEFEKSVARHFLGPDSDPVTSVGNILRSGTAREQMADLARLTATDPTARQSVQRAVIDYMLRELKSNNPVGADLEATYLKSDALQNFIRRHVGEEGAGALRAIMDPAQLDALGRVATDLRRSNLSNTANRVSMDSTTGENLSAMHAHDHRPSTAGMLAAMEAGGEAAGHIGGGFGRIVGLIAPAILNRMRQNGFRTVDDLVAEAVLRPDKMRALLDSVPAERAVPSRLQALGAQMRALGAQSLATEGARQ